ncbi:MAG: radical SAM protein [Ruminococcaceae bacterium]|nr:radical SAM protein [Oscillospiraceae bacterium]
MLCNICPRRCGANREAEPGYCGASDTLRIARAAPHFWEEPCISGTNGTGAVFFSGCNLKCKFCQNYDISAHNKGYDITEQQLADEFQRLESEDKCHSISLITPGHFVPGIIRAMDMYSGSLPFVYNCGGYESVQTLKALEGRISVYLPDLKYSDSELAKQLSDAPDYFDVAKSAILEMYRQVGDYELDEKGLLKKGVVIRHLLLPGNTANTFGVLDWISETFSEGQVLVSLMCQYVPYGKAKEMPPFDRPVTESEYRRAVRYMEAVGITDGFVQEPDSASEQFIPEFYGKEGTENDI